MIGIGIVGFGYWGPNLARVAADTAGARLAAIADSAPQALARAAQRHRDVTLHADWRALVADPAVDLVMVSTPVRTHFEIALAALRAGKHVLVEKPIAPTVAEARLLVDEAARRRLVLMVDHTFIYTPAVRRIKSLIAAGEIGDLYYYDSTRVNLGLFQRDVNVVWDLAVHDLAILDHLMERSPVAVSATGSDVVGGHHENVAHVTLYYGCGATAHLNVNWLAPVKVRRTLIGGSRRMIVWDDLEPDEKVKVYDRGVDVASEADRVDRRVSYRTGDMWSPRLPLTEALATEFEHLIDCVRNGAAPQTSGGMGVRVVEILEGASASMQRRGQPVDLEAPLRIAS
jgi:predicted dehydrogenase